MSTSAPHAWISVGELGAAFKTKGNTLPPTGKLAGLSLTLHFENGWVIEHRFRTAKRLQWRSVLSKGRHPWTTETYLATEVRDGIFFVDYPRHLERATTVSLVLDLNAAIFTAMIGQLPTRSETKEGIYQRALAGKDLTGVKATILSGSINQLFSEGKTPWHQPTDELIGKRIEYTYSPTATNTCT
jgi:hypothetical protein